MRQCTDLTQEMVKQAKDRQAARSNSSCATYHTNLLGDENDPSLPDNDAAINLIDATLNLLDMDKADGWMIDSGASRSVIGDLTRFQSGSIEKALGTVSTASGQNLPAATAGTVELANNGEIKLHEVLYVPGITKNLLFS